MPDRQLRLFGSKTSADVFCQFIAQIGKQRQLLGGDELGDPLDQPAFLHLVGNLGDDDLPDAAPGILLLPARAHAERSAPVL